MSVQDLFKRHFGYAPTHIVRAPGRLELLGGLAEHNEGLALSAAVDKYVSIASAPRRDGQIELVSSATSFERFWINELKSNPAAPGANGVKAVLERLRRRGVNFRGFDAVIHSEIPSEADMGSEAALAAATLLTLRRLHPFSLTATGLAPPPSPDARGELPRLGPAEKWHCARLLQTARSAFQNAAGSLLDMISTLFGKAGHAMSIDFRFLTVEYAPLMGEAIVVCDAGRTASPNRDELSLRCESAARQLSAKSLRSVDLKYLEANKSRLTPVQYDCARYVVGETALVVAAERALRGDDHRQFGQYLFRSHESACEFLKNNPGETDVLVELARAHPGCLGSRDLGGMTINLVAHHQAEVFRQDITRQFKERSGSDLRATVCQIVEGAA